MRDLGGAWRKASGENLRRRFVTASFWYVVGTIVARGMSFVMMALLARVLGKVEFGKLAMLESSIATIGALTSLGLGITALRYVAAHRQNDPARVGRILALLLQMAVALGFVSGAIAFGASSWIADALLHAPELDAPLRVSSFALFASLINGIPAAALIGLQRFKQVATLMVLQGAITFLFALPLAYLYGVLGMAIALAIAGLVGTTLGVWVLLGELRAENIPLLWRQSWRERGVVFSFSIPGFISVVSYTPAFWLANALLIRASGYEELGLLNAGMQLNFLVTAASTMFAQVTTSFLSEAHGLHRDGEEYWSELALNIRLNWGWALLVGYVVALWPEWLARLYGGGFSGLESILPLTAAAAVTAVGCTASAQFFSSSGRMWAALATTMFWAMTFLGIFHFGFSHLGARGLVTSLLIAYLMTAITHLLLIWRAGGHRPDYSLLASLALMVWLAGVAWAKSGDLLLESVQWLGIAGAIICAGKFILSDVRGALSQRGVSQV